MPSLVCDDDDDVAVVVVVECQSDGMIMYGCGIDV